MQLNGIPVEITEEYGSSGDVVRVEKVNEDDRLKQEGEEEGHAFVFRDELEN